MKKTFKLNEKTYNTKPFTLELVCDLEDYGVSMDDYDSKFMKFMRAYVALCAGIAPVDAGKEIEAHVIKGGSFKELSDIIAKGLDESDFFRNIIKNAEAENQKVQSKAEVQKQTEA